MRRFIAFLLAAYGAGMLGVLLLPVGQLIGAVVGWLYRAGRSVGMPGFLTTRWYEFALNGLLFMVPTMLAILLWPQVRRWVWLVLGACLSAVVEVTQLLMLPRSGEIVDVIANTAGSASGVALIAILGWPKAKSAYNPVTSIHIDNVPENLRTRLECLATERGRSLDSFLLDELARIAGPHSRGARDSDTGGSLSWDKAVNS